MPAPTPMASGRLRPVRDVVAGACCVVASGSTGG